MTSSALDRILLQNVCDIRFVRKRPIKGRANTRRMWATKSWEMLNSTNGRVTLNYRPPRKNKTYNESKNGVIIVWDILMQDYRTNNAAMCEIITTVKAGDDFWSLFNDTILPMNSEDKMNFMNS